MVNRYVNAELLTALWKLGAGDHEPGPNEHRIPTSHGILDRALKECQDSLPKALANQLSFGVTSVGLRCYELPDILLAAQEAMLTSEPNPTYRSSIVTIDESRAKQIVVGYGLSSLEAKAIGKKLVATTRSIQEATMGEQEQLLTT